MFLLLCATVFPLYIYHNFLNQTIRYDALYYNWYFFIYIFHPNTLLFHLKDILIILSLWLIGHLVGKVLLLFISSKCYEVTSFYITIPLGWGVVSYVVFILALIHMLTALYISIILSILLLGSLLILWQMRALPSWFNLYKSIKSGVSHKGVKLFYLILLFSLLISLSSSLMPPTQSDGLRYHLSVPKIYLDQGVFVSLPMIAFSNFPFLIEYLYCIPLAFDSLCGPKLIHCSYYLLTLALVYRLGKRLGGRISGFFSSLFLATIPFVPIFSSWSFIEFGLTCYTLLGFIFCLRYVEKVRKGKIQTTIPEVILIGISGGFLLGCKYTALATVFFYLILSLILTWKHAGWIVSIIRLSIGGIVSFIIASLWYIKNILLFNNPLYPFATSIFSTPYWTDFNGAFFSYHAGMKGHLNAVAQYNILEKVLDFITLPARLTFMPQDFGDWPAGCLLIAILPLLLIIRRWDYKTVFVFIMGCVLFFVWAYTYRDTRFLLPTFAFFSILCGMIFHKDLIQWPLVKWLVLGMVVYGVVGTYSLTLLHGKYEPWFVVGQHEVRGVQITDEYYLENINEFTRYENQAFRYLKENTDVSQTVLLHGIEHPFYCPNDFIGADWFNTDPLIAWSWECTSYEELLNKLKEHNVEYIVYYYGKIKRPGYFDYYRLFRLPIDRSLPLLQDLNESEKMRAKYKEMYDRWFKPRYNQRVTTIENEALNVQLLHALLDEGRLEEVFRFEESDQNPYEGIKILKVP